jgi:hypothetical protein
MIGLTLFLGSVALALPDRVAATLEGEAADSLVGNDTVAAWFEGDEVVVLDGGSWETVGVDPGCTGAAGLALQTDSTGGEWLFVGCSDGTLVRIDATPGTRPVVDGTVSLATESIVGLTWDDTLVYAVTQPAGGGLEVYSYDMAADQAMGPYTITRGGFEDVGQSASYVIILQGSDDVSKVDKGTGAAMSNVENLGGRNWVDVVTDGNSGIFLADSGGAVARYLLSTNEFNLVLLESDGLDTVDAIALDADGAEPYLALAEGTLGEIWWMEFDPSSLAVGDTPLATLAVSGVESMVPFGEALLVTASEGGVMVLTEAPWVEAASDHVGVLAQGDVANVSFAADTDGDWEVSRASGTVLASGSLVADGVVEVPVTIDGSYVEGNNRITVTVVSNTRVGHDAVDLPVDNPPSALQLADDAIRFGNEEILVRFDGIEDADLDRYDLYLTTEPFDGADYGEGGGPAYAGPETTLAVPVAIAGEPEEAVDVSIGPLLNEQTYYVAVRAVDSAGQEGPMSQVFEVTPTPALGAAELAGEPGGCGCGHRGAPLGWLALALAGLALVRRSPGFVLALVLASSFSTDALAGTNKAQDVEVRLGFTSLDNASIADVYGEGESTSSFVSLLMESGYQWFRMAELDVGLGLIRGKGDAVGLAGDTPEPSGYPSRLVLLPVSLSATLRADFWDGQPVVPYVRAGGEYWLWFEQVKDEETYLQGGRGAGGKIGWSYGGGVNVLLDIFSQERSGNMKARWGVEDSYFTVDWRRQAMLEMGGLSFEGESLTVGLKLDK